MASVVPFEETAGQASSLDLSDIRDSSPEQRGSFDFRYITSAVRANLLLIGAIIAAAIAVAVIATMLQTPRYTANSTLQINDSVNRVLKDDDTSQANEMGYDVDRNLKTQVDIMKSRGLATRVAQKLNLASNPAFFASQNSAPPAAGAPAEASVSRAAGLLQSNLAVTLPRDSRIITLSWESADPQMSALIANAYASEVIQSNLQRKFESSSYARNFVSQQLAETKQKLEASERALNDYARQNGLIRTGDTAVTGADGKSAAGGGTVTTTSLLQLNAALNDATTRRIAAEGRWRAFASKPLLSTPEVLNSSSVNQLLTQRALLESELQQERSRHLDGYPTIQSKQAAIASINRQLQQAGANVRDSIRSEYQAAAETERNLAAQVSQLKGATLSEQDRNVRYSLLAREADTNRQLYDGLLQRYKELNASAGIALSNISIIDAADVPGGPSSPNLMRNLMMAVFAGVLLAAITVYLKEQFDDSIRVPEDVESKLSLPLLGVVPSTRSEEPEEELGDPKSPISEAYNSLRGSLLHSTRSGMPQVMMFTSAQPSEGKTTSALAVASSFARMGKRVLIIDADLRRPSLHKRIGNENQVGLCTLLTSQQPLANVLQASGQDNLSVLTSGPVPPSPTELLSSGRLEQVVHEAAQAFELIIIDSPPVLGLADAPTMAALADGVVFIVEAGRSRRGGLKAALRRLRSVRPVLLGAVLTKFDPLKAGNRHSEYYGYEYYQYGTSPKQA